jgi:hypothetical protein
MMTMVREPAPKEPLVAVREDIQWLAAASLSDKRRSAGIGCLHTCRHRTFRPVATGSDDAHYQLVVCTDPDGCNGTCRGWLAKEPVGGIEFTSRRIPYLALMPA